MSATGAKVKAINVPAGQTRAQVSVSGPTGVYCVSRLQKGKVSETKKIVVK